MMWQKWVGIVCTVCIIWCLAAPAAQAGDNNFSIVVTYDDGNFASLQISALNISSAIAQAYTKPHVIHAEPDVEYHIAITPNDPLFASQTQLTQINAPTAWDTRTDSKDVIVAVLDSGVDISNPDLVNNIWINPNETTGNGVDDDKNGFVDDLHGWNFIESNANPSPQLTAGATAAGLHHGTVVAGIIGAQGNNSVGIAGLNWNVKILPVRVLDSTGSGTTVTVAKGIDYAVAAGADVINLSFVGPGISPTLANSISEAQADGVIIVAAAGNENLDLDITPQYPVCYSGVVGVGSVNASDVKSSFSNYGSCIDIVAPGENVASTLFYSPGSGYTEIAGNGWYGTSVASPFVSGAFTLLRASMPNASTDSIEKTLKDHAVSISALNTDYPNDLGIGRLNLQTLIAEAVVISSSHANILAIPKAGDSPRVREYSGAGKLLKQFFGATQKLRSGAVVRSGDTNGDGEYEIVTATLTGSEARVRIFNRSGQSQKSFLVFPTTYRGGVSLAVGDVTGDKQAEIVIGTETGSSQVRVFSGNGEILGQFFAFTKQYRGGISIAIGDLNADGANDIVVSKRSVEARVSSYTLAGKLQQSFLVFPRSYHSGAQIALGDVTGDGRIDIVAGAAKGTPTVRILSATGALVRSYNAYDKGQTGGVSVTIGDVDGDGAAEIITGTGPGAKPEVRLWRNAGQQRFLLFNAFTPASRTGIDVSVIPNS